MPRGHTSSVSLRMPPSPEGEGYLYSTPSTTSWSPSLEEGGTPHPSRYACHLLPLEKVTPHQSPAVTASPQGEASRRKRNLRNRIFASSHRVQRRSRLAPPQVAKADQLLLANEAYVDFIIFKDEMFYHFPFLKFFEGVRGNFFEKKFPRILLILIISSSQARQRP